MSPPRQNVPVAEVEIEVFETGFGDLLDGLFSIATELQETIALTTPVRIA